MKNRSIDKIMRKYNIPPKKMSAGILVLAGALLLLSGFIIFMLIYQYFLSPEIQIAKQNIHSEGIILKKIKTQRANGSFDHEIEYSFQINNKIYRNIKILNYKIYNKVKKGDNIKIFYDKNNPSKNVPEICVTSDTGGLISIILIAIGLGIAGIFLIIIYCKHNAKVKRSINHV
jgi:hypothetical protein